MLVKSLLDFLMEAHNGISAKIAEAYYDAGADGILIHSALNIPDQVLAFKREWGDRSPVVIVPIKYYATPTEVFRDADFSIAIWANHLLRASVTMNQLGGSLPSLTRLILRRSPLLVATKTLLWQQVQNK